MKIAFLDLYKWDYQIETAYIRPLSGTQSAVCFLAEALAQMGHEVFLFNHTSEGGVSRNVNCCKLPIADPLLWRSLDYLIIVSVSGFAAESRYLAGDRTRIILWLHVDPTWATLNTFNTIRELNAIDAFVFVSEWHKQEFCRYYDIGPERCHVLRNAIAPHFAHLFTPNENILSHKPQPPIFAYTSVPYRGLELLLNIFPKIRQAIPGATLKIFSSMKIYQYSDTQEGKLYAELYDRCYTTEGVIMKGSVSRAELAEELKTVTALTYPNAFPETSCIIAMEAMASGCQIITSDLGALRETTAGYGQLIPTSTIPIFSTEKQWQIANHPAWQNYGEAFLQATLEFCQKMQDKPTIINQKLQQQVAYINNFCTWSVRAQEWTKFLAQLGKKNQAELTLATAQNYLSNGERNKAIELTQAVIKKEPYSSSGYELLGLIYQGEQRYQAATMAYRYAGKFNAHPIIAMINYALILAINNNFDQAIWLWESVLKVSPRVPEVYNYLGQAFYLKNDWYKAIFGYERALEIQPDSALAIDKLAEIYDLLAGSNFQQSNPELALNYLQKAQQIQPTKWRHLMSAFITPRIYQNRAELEQWRQQLEMKINQLPQIDLAKLSMLPSIMINHFIIPYQGFNDRNLNQQISKLYQAIAISPSPRPQLPPQLPGEKIKIGFLSSHFYHNSVTQCFANIIQQLPKAKFSIYLLFSPYTEKSDETTEKLRKIADQSFMLPKNLVEAAQGVSNLQLDLLIYPEIGMEAFVYILSLHRLAPTQCVLAGHPVTSGSPQIDYYISSELMEIDNAQNHYTEKLIKLPSLAVDYDQPSLPSVMKTRTDLGLPENRHLYICPMTLIKVHPDFDEAIGQILRQDELGEMIFFTNHLLEEKLQLRWRSNLPDIQHRIKFLPWAEHQDFMNILMLADVVLDTFHFSGLNTALITMATGTPMVTWPSPYLRGRFCYGVYQRLGVMDCVAQSLDQYVKIALKIAQDVNYRQQIKTKILQNNHLLYNDRQALNEMVQLFTKLAHS